MLFKKMKIKRKIKKYEKQIAQLEKKRMRSQAALIEAILQHTTPHDADVDYFNNYSAQIDYFRVRIHEEQNKLKSKN